MSDDAMRCWSLGVVQQVTGIPREIQAEISRFHRHKKDARGYQLQMIEEEKHLELLVSVPCFKSYDWKQKLEGCY
jgi:hypothetical protein